MHKRIRKHAKLNPPPQYCQPSSPKSSRAVRSITVPHMIFRQVVRTKFSNANDKVKKKQLRRYEELEEEMEMWEEGQEFEG